MNRFSKFHKFREMSSPSNDVDELIVNVEKQIVEKDRNDLVHWSGSGNGESFFVNKINKKMSSNSIDFRTLLGGEEPLEHCILTTYADDMDWLMSQFDWVFLLLF